MSLLRVAKQQLGSIAQRWYVSLTDGTNVLGTGTNPVRTDPTGSTSQPVTGTVSVTDVATETTLGQIKAKTDNIPTSPATDRAAATAPFAVRLSDGAAWLGVALETTLSAIKTLLDTTGIKVSTMPAVAVELQDDYGYEPEYTAMGEQRVAQVTKLAGSTFDSASLDAAFWTKAVGASGDAVMGVGQLDITCGTNASGYCSVKSVRAGRYVARCQNGYRSQIQLGDSGAANNTRIWGAGLISGYTISDGAYFKLDGTTLYVATKKAGSNEVAVDSAHWSLSQTVPTLTNCNTFEIYWTNKKVLFVINDVPVHEVSASAATWTSKMTLGIINLNLNSGNTSEKTLSVRVASVARLGQLNTESTWLHVSGTAPTALCKLSPGRLHHICINTPASSTSVLTVYDNPGGAGGAGTVMGVITVPNNAVPWTQKFDAPFHTGLTIVGTGTWDLTVVYE